MTKLKPARYRAILAYAMEAHYDCMPIEEIRELAVETRPLQAAAAGRDFKMSH
jgi:hypothetical protein